MKKTLGGDRLGSGNKMKVDLHGFERSTHDLSYLWRSTMAAGTLVPFLSEVALPGDTFDINLNAILKTHPTVGPLFGSYKVQLDVFQAPMRLYHSALHNNQLGIGLKMDSIKLPTLTLTALVFDSASTDRDNSQINPSALPSYLGIRGIGNVGAGPSKDRKFNAIPTLAYWEIYKNYYANKQEEIGAVLHSPADALITTINQISIGGNTLQLYPTTPTPIYISSGGMSVGVAYAGASPDLNQVQVDTDFGTYTLAQLLNPGWFDDLSGLISGTTTPSQTGNTWYSWYYINSSTPSIQPPSISTFPLSNIDDMRHKILSHYVPGTDFNLNTETPTLTPYKWLWEQPNGIPNLLSSQEGLGLKTYQSDLFNNWLQTEWIDGVGGINDITSIDTSGGSFSIDTLNLSKKVYDMLNRIAVSGGSYDDWLDAQYSHERYTRAESPIYLGGLSKELVFQEVVSNTQTQDQPLGTLGGKGVMAQKHKGGKVTVKVDEPSYIIGIISLTPRLDYSQGNKWDTGLLSMNDLHVPSLDEIGFQELITEQMAWWSTEHDGTKFIQKSAGKQPAWLNYMTNVNQVRGNFAIENSEMFMTLNRKYEYDDATGDIKDLTTYIDPSKYNSIFAETQLDAQNFWAQIAVDMTVRRKMSAKVMPNL
jgi:hypothetical protein